MDKICAHFVRLFRKGHLGKVNLDFEDVEDVLASGTSDG